MKRLPAATLCAVLSLTAAVAGHTQTGSGTIPPPPPRVMPPKGQVPVAQGRLEGGRYSNDFFGISFSIPRDWVVQDAAAKKLFTDEGKKIIVEGATAKKRAQLDAAIERAVLLLSVSKYDPRIPSPLFNAHLSCAAERVPTAIVKTGDDYLALLRRTFQGTAAKMEMIGPVRTERLGGVAFSVANVKVSAGPVVMIQRHYVTVMKGHALVLTYSYIDEEDVKTIDDIIKSVKFK